MDIRNSTLREGLAQQRDSVGSHTRTYRRPVCRYCDVLPRTAKIVAALLLEEGYARLCKQMPELMIFEKCSCQSPDCASFYTQPKPEGPYGPGHWGFTLKSPAGLIVLDILNDKIAFIEILRFPLASSEVAANWSRISQTESATCRFGMKD